MLSYGSFRAVHTGDSRSRVLPYVHDSLIVGCESDGSFNPSKVVVAYGSKGNLLLIAMVGFTLMISSSYGCLIEVQSSIHMIQVWIVC